MTLKNAEVTLQIEELTKNFKRMNEQTLPNVKKLLGPTYSNPTAPISLETLNQNYKNITGTSKDLIPVMVKYTPQDKQQLADIAVIQLRAIADGFENVAQNSTESTPKPAPKKAARSSYVNRSAQTATPRNPRIEVYHYRRSDDNFWRDMMLWNMIFGNNGSTTNVYNNYGDNNKNSEEKVGLAGIMFAGLMIAGALGTIGYSVMQTYYRIDEIVHGEDMLANTAKVSVTAFAAWQGYMLGAMLGAAAFANPVLGGLCAACIVSAGAMKLSKWGAELYHQSNNTTSALDYDPRFCLNASQESYYSQTLSLNSDVANEALRECAIAMKSDPTNGLIFWQNPHAELINLVRNIKTGNVPDKIIINEKTFDLSLPMKPKQHFGPKPSMATTSSDTYQSSNEDDKGVTSSLASKVDTFYSSPIATVVNDSQAPVAYACAM